VMFRDDMVFARAIVMGVLMCERKREHQPTSNITI
jgi:hypothetical protein